MRYLLVISAIFFLISRVQSISEVCKLPSDVGPCRSHEQRYFYNSASKACEQFIYGGCQGNENNFISIQECQSKCSGE